MPDLASALAGLEQRQAEPVAAVILNQAVYASFAASMPPAKVHALYTMCLDDAERRLRTMEAASEARDADAYIRAAHAIKGGCGMVGAVELAALAGTMEMDGLPEVDSKAPFGGFLAAIRRLRRMLDAQTL
jgi:HPt (histidine-containing phosphotransfer) domain-containing protein